MTAKRAAGLREHCGRVMMGQKKAKIPMRRAGPMILLLAGLVVPAGQAAEGGCVHVREASAGWEAPEQAPVVINEAVVSAAAQAAGKVFGSQQKTLAVAAGLSACGNAKDGDTLYWQQNDNWTDDLQREALAVGRATPAVQTVSVATFSNMVAAQFRGTFNGLVSGVKLGTANMTPEMKGNFCAEIRRQQALLTTLQEAAETAPVKVTPTATAPVESVK